MNTTQETLHELLKTFQEMRGLAVNDYESAVKNLDESTVNYFDGKLTALTFVISHVILAIEKSRE